MKTTGRNDKTSPTTVFPDFPAAIISAAPTQGKSAAAPGKGVAGLNKRPAKRMDVAPHNEAIFLHTAPVIAGKQSIVNSVPSSNSQALVCAR